MKSVLFAAVVSLISSLAIAQAAAPAAADACSTGSEADQINCLTALYGSTEAALGTAYKARLQALKDREQFDAVQAVYYENLSDLVITSQRVWVIDRESQCNLESMMSQKAAYTIPTKMRCQIRIAQQRTNFLNNFAITVRK